MCCKCDNDAYYQREREASNNDRIAREQREQYERDSYRRMNDRQRQNYNESKRYLSNPYNNGGYDAK